MVFVGILFCHQSTAFFVVCYRVGFPKEIGMVGHCK